MNFKLGLKKNGLFICLAFAILLTTACKKDETDPYLETWKQQNDQAFNNLASNPDYQELRIPGGVGNIYYRVLQKGEGKRTYYNSRAEVYYKGWYVVTNTDYSIKAGDIFDQRLFDDGITFKVAVSDQVANSTYRQIGVYGWKIALQHMVEGDKWEVVIPYRLAYEEQGTTGIPGYSTLAFEIELIKALDPDEFEWPSGGSSDPYYNPYY